MPSPDPKEFAKHVLWHIAALRADMEQMRKYLLSTLAASSGDPAKTLDEFDANWKEQSQRIRDAIYQHALQQAGLGDPPSEPPPSGRGDDGRVRR